MRKLKVRVGILFLLAISFFYISCRKEDASKEKSVSGVVLEASDRADPPIDPYEGLPESAMVILGVLPSAVDDEIYEIVINTLRENGISFDANGQAGYWFFSVKLGQLDKASERIEIIRSRITGWRFWSEMKSPGRSGTND